MNHRARVERLAAGLASHEIDALLITDLTNVRYLTGYTGSNGAVVSRRQLRLSDRLPLSGPGCAAARFIDVQQANRDLSLRLTRWAEFAPGAAGRL
jgi:Xaa-Pro aminopeptidase